MSTSRDIEFLGRLALFVLGAYVGAGIAVIVWLVRS